MKYERIEIDHIQGLIHGGCPEVQHDSVPHQEEAAEGQGIEAHLRRPPYTSRVPHDELEVELEY